jgi:hypothetical protein
VLGQRRLEIVFRNQPGLDQALADLLPHPASLLFSELMILRSNARDRNCRSCPFDNPCISYNLGHVTDSS